MGVVNASNANAGESVEPEIVVHSHKQWNSIVGFLSPFRRT